MAHVLASEFACKCDTCGHSNYVSMSLVSRLNQCRSDAGIPFVINSGYRCEWHNRQVGGSPNSTHMHGEAADIKANNSRHRYAIVKTLLANGFKRIGIYKTFIHCDISETHGQEVIWYG